MTQSDVSTGNASKQPRRASASANVVKRVTKDEKMENRNDTTVIVKKNKKPKSRSTRELCQLRRRVECLEDAFKKLPELLEKYY